MTSAAILPIRHPPTKIVGMNSTVGQTTEVFTESSPDLHGGFPMRRRFNPQPRLDCPPIEMVKLNVNCRDEIIPILRALQHIYSDHKLRREILDLVGEDVNRERLRQAAIHP